jgi:dephospho-CoA kinase
LMTAGHAVYDAIVKNFGPSVVREDGALDRRRLAELAFGDGRLAELNGIVHPAVIEAEQRWAEDLFARDSAAIAMVESALIFEAEVEGTSRPRRERFDKVVLIMAPDAIKVARYAERLAATAPRTKLEADARMRLAAQIPDAQKAPLVDFVIENDGSLTALRAAVEKVYGELVRAARNL